MKNKFRDSYLAYCLMVGFYFLGVCLFSGLISVYLLDMGFSPSQVSMVVAGAQLAMLLLNPQVGVLQSRFGGRKVNMVLLLLAALCSLLFAAVSNYWLIVLFYALCTTGMNCSSAMIDRLTLQSPYAYGKIRIFGCIGAAVGMQAAGLIYDYISPRAVYVATALCWVVCIASLACVVDRQGNTQQKTSPEKKRGAYGPLLSNRKFLYYLLIVFLFFGAIATSNTYSAAMLVSEGLEVSLTSTVVFFACMLEIPFVLMSNRYLDRIANKNLLLIMLSLFLSGALIRGINFSLETTILATVLTKHLPSMLHIMVNMKIISTIVEEKDQVLALTATYTVQSLSSMICVNVAGWILEVSTYSSMFFFCSACALAALVLVPFFKIPAGKEKTLFG